MSDRSTVTALMLTVSVILTLAANGCATLSNRSKTLLLMGGAAVAAGTIGAMLAPLDENQGAHALLWGGSASAIAGVIGLFAFDEEEARRAAEDRSAHLQKELASCAAESTPELMATHPVGLEKPLPSQFRNLITPGQWSLYKVDRWTSASDSELVHQDLIFRFSQPQLNPSSKAPLPQADDGERPRKEAEK